MFGSGIDELKRDAIPQREEKRGETHWVPGFSLGASGDRIRPRIYESASISFLLPG